MDRFAVMMTMTTTTAAAAAAAKNCPMMKSFSVAMLKSTLRFDSEWTVRKRKLRVGAAATAAAQNRGEVVVEACWQQVADRGRTDNRPPRSRPASDPRLRAHNPLGRHDRSHNLLLLLRLLLHLLCLLPEHSRSHLGKGLAKTLCQKRLLFRLQQRRQAKSFRWVAEQRQVDRTEMPGLPNRMGRALEAMVADCLPGFASERPRRE